MRKASDSQHLRQPVARVLAGMDHPGQRFIASAGSYADAHGLRLVGSDPGQARYGVTTDDAQPRPFGAIITPAKVALPQPNSVVGGLLVM